MVATLHWALSFAGAMATSVRIRKTENPESEEEKKELIKFKHNKKTPDDLSEMLFEMFLNLFK